MPRDDRWEGAETRARWAAELERRARAHWTEEQLQSQLGDKWRRLLLPPAEAAPLLRMLGLLRGDGSMPADSVRKFMQINHMVALLEPVILDLCRDHEVVRVLDAGCGSSSLTLLLAWCFERRWAHRAQIFGVDQAAAVIDSCRRRAAASGLEATVAFGAAALEELDLGQAFEGAFGPSSAGLHGLIALHACDTATDDALGLGVAAGAELIAAAPCCQAELSRSWAALEGGEGAFAPLWRSPHLRREAAAIMTDALRALLLQGCGYRVTAMEFVPSSHTPKNTLLRAVRAGEADLRAFGEYHALRRALGGAHIRLARRLPPPLRAALDSQR